MGALYEDVERFFGDMFASYGRIVARFPAAFIVVSVMSCSLFGLGLLHLRSEYHVTRLYAPMESEALTDRDRLLELFPDHSQDDFQPHQSVIGASYGSVLVTTTLPGDNLLVSPTFKELRKVYDIVLNVSFTMHGQTMAYEDVCARRSGKCVVEGAGVLEEHLHNNCYVKHHVSIETYVYELEPQGDYQDSSDIDQDTKDHEANSSAPAASASAHHCTQAHTLRLRFFLRQNVSDNGAGTIQDGSTEAALLWQDAFLHALRGLAPRLHLTSLSYSVSDSFDVELYEHAGRDLRLLPVAVGVLGVLGVGIGGGGDWVSTHIVLAQAGLVAALLGLMAAFGALGLLGVPFVDICSVTPFLVLGKLIQNLFSFKLFSYIRLKESDTVYMHRNSATPLKMIKRGHSSNIDTSIMFKFFLSEGQCSPQSSSKKILL